MTKSTISSRIYYPSPRSCPTLCSDRARLILCPLEGCRLSDCKNPCGVPAERGPKTQGSITRGLMTTILGSSLIRQANPFMDDGKCSYWSLSHEHSSHEMNGVPSGRFKGDDLEGWAAIHPGCFSPPTANARRCSLKVIPFRRSAAGFSARYR